MKFTVAAAVAALVGAASAGSRSDERTFAVLRFNGKELVKGRMDPIVSPGVTSAHVHGVMGGSNFGVGATGESLMKSQCSNAKIKGDNSAYWFPWLYFEDPKTKKLEPVEIFYVNVYYFFDGTDDDIKAFPVGLSMVSGNAMTRVVPAGADGGENLEPADGPVSGVQWTCPRPNFNPPSWPTGSDGSTAGIGDPNNKGSGIGFPTHNCDGYASPLRADIHFPSCYNPEAGLTNFKENMAWPSNKGASNSRRKNCPEGWIHVPHIFFEVYWNTPKFVDRWTQDSGTQPFVLANGDTTGFSSHADFLAAWDPETLQHIIDTCDAGSRGMDNCAGLKYGLNDEDEKCTIPSEIDEVIDGVLDQLPGNNPLRGWKYGTAAPGGGSADPVPSTSAAPPAETKPAETKPAETEPEETTSAEPIQTSAPPAEEETEPAPAPIAVTTEKPAPASSTTTPTVTLPPVVVAPEESSQCTVKVSTVWETVTVWGTATEHASGPSPTAAPGNSTGSVAGFTYAGCFKDSRERSLTGESRPNLGAVTNELCVTHCKEAGFALAGTEYGGQCYCGNELEGSEKLEESACDVPCEGDDSSICGGGWALSVYSVDGEASIKTGSTKARRHVHNHALRHRSARN